MNACRILARRLSLALLFVAAVDLSYPAGCADGPVVNSSMATVCAGGHQADTGHDGEDCFCCSRTVRAEEVTPFRRSNPVATVVNDAPASLADALDPPLYHPPLA